MRAYLLSLILICFGLNELHAQVAKKDLYARIVFIKPKEGKSKEFEEGYKRHLGWHKENKDTWSWYGWSITTEERWGQFMDGTFFRTLKEFDNPVNPSADQEDNSKNVIPYADFQTVITLKYIDYASKRLKDSISSKFLKIYVVDVTPGKSQQFLAAVSEMLKASTATCFTFQVIMGDSIPKYYLFVPYSTSEDIAKTEELFYSQPQTDLSSVISKIKIETLRYRPELSME